MSGRSGIPSFVDPATQPDLAHARLAERVAVLEFRSRIAQALGTPDLEGAQITADLKGPVVTLNGTVLSGARRMRAEEIARSSRTFSESTIGWSSQVQ